MRNPLPILATAATLGAIGIGLMASLPAAAEPAGDDPIFNASVTVWYDGDGNGLYGTGLDQPVGTDQTDEAGRWDVDITNRSEGPLGVVAVIEQDLLRHPIVCESDPFKEWVPSGTGNIDDKCFNIGGDLFGDNHTYLNGVVVESVRDRTGEGIYGPVPPDIRLAPTTVTQPVLPGAGDFRFFDIKATDLEADAIGVVIHVLWYASGHSTLSGILWEPSSRQF